MSKPSYGQKEYERGFIDGMQKQMQSSVDKAVNGMTRTWVGLTDEEIMEPWPFENRVAFARWLEAKLKEKNT